MTTRASIWRPRYTLTTAIARALMKIEAARAVVENIPSECDQSGACLWFDGKLSANGLTHYLTDA